MAREYQAEFASDFAVLTFVAEDQEEAIKIVENHAVDGEEFILKARDSSQTPWGDLKRSSYWRVGYGAASVRRVR